MKIWHLGHCQFPENDAQNLSFIKCKDIIESKINAGSFASLLLAGSDIIEEEEWAERFRVCGTSILGEANICYANLVYKDNEYQIFINTNGSERIMLYALDVNKILTYSAVKYLDKITDERYTILVDKGANLWLPCEI